VKKKREKLGERFVYRLYGVDWKLKFVVAFSSEQLPEKLSELGESVLQSRVKPICEDNNTIIYQILLLQIIQFSQLSSWINTH
jgi:hypothetical protein